MLWKTSIRGSRIDLSRSRFSLLFIMMPSAFCLHAQPLVVTAFSCWHMLFLSVRNVHGLFIADDHVSAFWGRGTWGNKCSESGMGTVCPLVQSIICPK